MYSLRFSMGGHQTVQGQNCTSTNLVLTTGSQYWSFRRPSHAGGKVQPPQDGRWPPIYTACYVRDSLRFAPTDSAVMRFLCW
jgi:hypothetical protein